FKNILIIEPLLIKDQDIKKLLSVRFRTTGLRTPITKSINRFGEYKLDMSKKDPDLNYKMPVF
ncbi:MAG: hypothetical protein ACI9IL_001160, partial [Rickettsiales bacterium]